MFIVVKKRTKKGPFQQWNLVLKDLRSKKGPKKDHYSSLVLKRTKSLIKDLYASTAFAYSYYVTPLDIHIILPRHI